MKILLACILALSLTGCAEIDEYFEKKEEKTETAEQPVSKQIVCSNDEYLVRMDAADDYVNKFEHVIYMKLEDLAIPKDSKDEEIQKYIDDAVAKMYEEVKGVQVSGTYEEGRVKIVVEVDYEEADIDELVEAGLLDKGEVQNQYVSLERTLKDLESQGYACEVKE